jgi:hypothetical protein
MQRRRHLVAFLTVAKEWTEDRRVPLERVRRLLAGLERALQ